jgi:hypothetical protein
LHEFDVKTKDCKGSETNTKKTYNITYATEIEFNEAFKTFVINFKLACQGPNTAHVQIGSTSTIRYSEEIEPLPLGPKFQEHVACFME